MLVLTREFNKSIIVTVPASNVARTIEIMVVEIRGNKVRIGVEADRDIIVHRDEVQAAIERENAMKGEAR